MSEQNWKPGDVIAIDETPMFVVEVTANSRAAWGEGLHAVDANGNGWRVSSLCLDSPRRLVVIDPEDREQVERLRNETLRALRDHIGNRAVDECAFTEGDLANAMQTALREFANPTQPKPEEPTDPTSRVTDRRDNIWRLLADGDWVCVSGPDHGEYIAWSRLAAERGPLTVEVPA